LFVLTVFFRGTHSPCLPLTACVVQAGPGVQIHVGVV